MGDSGQRLTGTNQGNVQIEDINCRLVFRAADGRVMRLGVYSEPGDTVKFGMAMYDATGTLVSEVDFTTWFWYDKDNANVNQIQLGKMPDNSYNIVIAKTGEDVREAF